MTVISPPETTPDSGRRSRTSAADQARQRRERRHAKLAAAQPIQHEPLLSRARRSARQLPFVLLLVGLLGAGLVGVLWLNTLTDEAGMQASTARVASNDLQLKIDQVNADIAARNATPAIAQAAKSLGMVPAGDAAILVVPADPAATPTQLGDATAVVDPAVIAAQEAAAAAAAAQAAADAAAASAASVSAQASSEAQASAASSAAAAAATQTSGAPVDANAAVQQTTTAVATPVDAAAVQPADAVTTTGAVG